MNITIRAFFTGCLVLFQTQLCAQEYNFDTDEIPVNWYGNRSDFTVNIAGELQLNAAAGTTAAAVSWPVDVKENMSWEFFIRYDFAASATNYANFYLLSTMQDTGAPTNTGYYLKIGGESGTTDKIELIFQVGTAKTIILASAPGSVGGNTVAVRIRVCRLMTGEWILFMDRDGGRKFVKTGSGKHVSSNTFLYSGIKCFYTSTRRDKFYFDEIQIGEPFAISKIEFNTDNELQLTFTRQLNSIQHEQLETDLGQPYSIRVSDHMLKLETASAIDPGKYTVRFKTVQSVGGDTLLNHTFSIQRALRYYPGQLRITEWMSDPSPSYGLPEIEWVEVINVSNTRIETAQLSLSDPTKKVKLPPYTLQKDSVVVLCSAGGCRQMNINNCIEVDALPNLNNSADSLFLWANDTILIDYIQYDLAALPNDYRKDGGYTIMRKSLPEPCFYTQELDFASKQNGGSPGYASNKIKQTALSATAVFHSAVLAEIELNVISNVQYEYLSGDVVLQSATGFSKPYSTCVHVFLEEPVPDGNAITLTLDSIRTCLNETQYAGIEMHLIYPEKNVPGSVYINEILYNAYTGGVDFIELFNTSQHYIQLKNTHFIYTDPKGKQQHAFVKNNQIISPNGFVVFTADTTVLKRQYPGIRLENTVQIPGFISFGDDGGALVMTNNTADTLDKVVFSDALQNTLNRNNEGTSLEKIDAYKTYFTTANWTSCAFGATPGYVNSQNLLIKTDEMKPFYCQPCHMTTDLNGMNDYILLYLSPHVAGAFASISIYTVAGQLVDNVCVNQLLGNENVFQWNGERQLNTILSDGIYIAVAEWWLPDGKVRTSKIAISTSHY